ncbi:hypothetical protein [Salinarchaeum sp. Harcht-Bsk1]|uniref:hypothetical protein n=1 Tax=Salinarchaeum sp. Harcht-Bsk1 TaxID=1333523 RepID=UPI001181C393|nr:hypothetical protein [Salinarchaeum sp. Harcht-Bsk1]
MKRHLRRALLSAGVAVALLASIDVVAASNVSAGLGSRGDVSVPTWLYAITGGGVIGASGLMSMLVTDRELLDSLHGKRVEFGVPNGLGALVSLAGGVIGVLALIGIVVVGFQGPQIGQVNAGVLLVFVGGRAGLTIVAYLVGNPWPAIDPWRHIASVLPTGYREYPERFGTWPAVGVLLVLIWLEVVLPVTSEPALLASLVLGYTAFTLAGAVAFGETDWFRHADPISVWYRYYGAVAPLQRTADGVALRPYGARLRDGDVFEDRSGVGFAILLVAELTFSGVIATEPGSDVVQSIVDAGIPSAIVYALFLPGLFGLFFGAYLLAARDSRERAQTFLSTRYLGYRFAGPLLAIAAGYHFAHYGGFLLSLFPTLTTVAQAPFSTLNPSQIVLPSWFGHVEALAILVGHVLAVWLAHGTAIDTFPGRVQAIRSQYPFILVMVAFTIASLWIISLPTISPV